MEVRLVLAGTDLETTLFTWEKVPGSSGMGVGVGSKQFRKVLPREGGIAKG